MNDRYTVITLFRNNKNDTTRINNLVSFLKYYKDLCNNIIIIEQDSESQIEDIVKQYRVNHLLVYNEYLFNRSWGFNIGANFAKQKLMPNNYLFIDCDIILSKEAIEYSIKFLGDNNIVSCKPYNCIYHLSQNTSNEWINNHNINSPFDKLDMTRASSIIMYCGGAVFIKRNEFYSIGGWNEDFEGWGGEDQELGNILVRKYTTARCITPRDKSYPCLHLYHTSGTGAGKKEHEGYEKNLIVLQKALNDRDINSNIAKRKETIIGKMLKYRGIK